MGSFSDYQPYENYMQGGMMDGNFASGAFTVLAAGPPRLANMGAGAAGSLAGGPAAESTAAVSNMLAPGGKQLVYPMGIVQNFNISQTRNFMRVWELGSERSYFVAGRNMGQIGLGRVYYHGASLLRILYAYYSDELRGGTQPLTVRAMYTNSFGNTVDNPHDVFIPPGYENIYLNLTSDLFAQPIGLMMLMRDVNLNTLSALYFEACYVPNHTFGVDAQGVLIQEQCGIQYERTVPIAVPALSLITDTAGGFAAARMK
jgi:hypothetical protein